MTLTLFCGTSTGEEPCGRPVATARLGDRGLEVLSGRAPVLPARVGGRTTSYVVACGKHGPKVVTIVEIQRALAEGRDRLYAKTPAPRTFRARRAR